jgi:L-aminopeptidase/D-esterase-like protein
MVHLPATLTEVPGVSVGQAADEGTATGVSAILFDRPCPTVVDIRGGASGTYDTASLSLDATFGLRLGIFFAGGSLYGLDAAAGVRRALLERGAGVKVFGNPTKVVPISGAILFDLPTEDRALPDYQKIGYRAARSADRAPVSMGSVGAGAGATVGKYLGRERGAKGGVGSAAARLTGLGRIGVLAAVNAVGAIRDPTTGRFVEGPRGKDGEVVPLGDRPRGGVRTARARGTTLVAVVTDAAVPRPALQRIAVLAHDGMARAIEPTHTATDGDVVFVSTTRSPVRSPLDERYPGATADRLGVAAQWLVVGAILRAVRFPWQGAR